MNIPSHLRIAWLVVFVLVCSAHPGLAAPAAITRKPNIVVIFTDDQTYRAIGYNNPLVKTPALDQLAGQGVIFERAYAASPICVASRASVMSGRYPQQHRSVGLDAKGFERTVIGEHRFQTLPECLAKAGYATALYGKSHLGDPKRYGFAEGRELPDVQDDQSFAAAGTFLTARAK